jgi:hypothetical protein
MREKERKSRGSALKKSVDVKSELLGKNLTFKIALCKRVVSQRVDSHRRMEMGGTSSQNALSDL